MSLEEHICWNCRMRAYANWDREEGWYCFEKMCWIAKLPSNATQARKFIEYTTKPCPRFRSQNI